jgi:UDP-4-amino-4,6-dideoxy-N-acetyl-beta-L-altrosamine transaminase
LNGKKSVSRLESRAGQRFLPYGRQLVDEDDIEAVAEVLRGDWLTTGPKVEAFEKALAAKLGAAHAVSCSSGTAGLHLAMMAMGLGPGDSVIVPTMTFVSTATMVSQVGAEVVFADVDPDTGLMGAAQFAEALERAGAAPVKAVIPVHLAGQCADLAEIAKLAEARGIHVVEDACHAIGSRYDDTLVGNCRDSTMAVFSFHPVKTIAMGEGGAVTTNDPALRERLALLRNHGMIREPEAFANAELAFDAGGSPNPWYCEMAEIGFNYRLSDINAALGLSQLGKLDRFAAKRRKLAETYDALLVPIAPKVRPAGRVPNCDAVWHLYQVLIDFEAAGLSRSNLMDALKEDGIGSQVHYIPVHSQPYYRSRYGDAALPGSEVFYRKCLSLPLSAGMDENDVERVVESLKKRLKA